MEQTPSCKYFRLLADEYIEGELTGEEMREFEAHIAECPECRKEFEELRSLKEMLAKSDEEIPEGLHERIMNAVSGEIKPRRSRLRVLRRAVISAACAVICLSLTVAFTLMPLWKEGTGSGLPEDPIAGEADVQTDISFSVEENAESVPDVVSEAVDEVPDKVSTEAENLPEADEQTYLAAESTAGGNIPDTHPETAKPETIMPETAKPETEAPVVETESPATEAEVIETPIEIKPMGDDNTSTSLSADADTILTASPEANAELGGEEITFALLIVSGLLAVASFIAFLISLSSVRNTPSKKNGEEEK